jgi:hypothetical protein
VLAYEDAILIGLRRLPDLVHETSQILRGARTGWLREGSQRRGSRPAGGGIAAMTEAARGPDVVRTAGAVIWETTARKPTRTRTNRAEHFRYTLRSLAFRVEG